MRALFLLTVIIILPLASAQNATVNTEGKPGVTPDKFLWGIDIALDHIFLLITKDETAKARRGILVVQERLLEIKKMGKEGKIGPLKRAQDAYAAAIAVLEESVTNLDESDLSDLNEELEIEAKLEEHINQIKIVQESISESLDREAASRMRNMLQDAENARLACVKKRETIHLALLKKGADEESLDNEIFKLKLEYKIKTRTDGFKFGLTEESDPILKAKANITESIKEEKEKVGRDVRAELEEAVLEKFNNS